MAGTKMGGLLAAGTNKAKHGADFYARIGAMGGKAGKTGGFAYSKANGLGWHIEAGRKGGMISRRGPGKVPKGTRVYVSKKHDPGFPIPVLVKPSRATMINKLKERMIHW